MVLGKVGFVSGCKGLFFSSVNVGYLELLVGVNGNEDLGEKLIREGYAVPRISNYVPAENEKFLVD